MKKLISFVLVLAFFPATTFSAQITVPSASTGGQVLISNSNGTYSPGTALATTTTGSLNGIIFVGQTHGFPFTLAGTQAAIDALPASGGMVVLPCYATSTNWGSYLLIVKSNVTMYGCGNSSVIYLADNSNSDVIRVGDAVTPVNNVQFYNFTIDGNRTNNTGACSGTSCTKNLIRYRSDAQNSYGGFAQGLVLKNGAQNGLSVESEQYFGAQNIISENNNDYGVWVESTGQVTLGPAIFTSGNGFAGAKFYYDGIVNLTGFTSFRDIGGGIQQQGGNNISMTGNSVMQAGYPSTPSDGVTLSTASSTVFTGNTINQSCGNGMQLYNVNASAFTGDTISNSSQCSSGSYSDIRFNSVDSTRDTNNVFSSDTFSSYLTNRPAYNIDQGQTGHTGNQFNSNSYGGALYGTIALTGSTNGVVDDSNGNYGFGTTSAPYLLTAGSPVIFSVDSLGNATTTGNIVLSKSKGLLWNDSNDQIRVDDLPSWVPGVNNVMTFEAYLGSFAFRDSSGGSVRMLISSSGNVGVGTTTPQSMIVVTKGTNATTTVAIGSLGLATSKACVNIQTDAGTAGYFYLNASGGIVSGLGSCTP